MENKKIIIKGIVQGVGFRPFVWKLAKSNNIKGAVKNTTEGVIIEAYGEESDLKKFIYELKRKKPKASRIDYFDVLNSKEKKFSDFKIEKSSLSKKTGALIPADLAICDKCVKDIENTKNRRYEYPFTNCTDCGPRFTIVEKVPYDRPFTTMKKFKMCDDCFEEYNDPQDRRFHAQPNACPICGPEVFLWEKGKITFRSNQAIEKLCSYLIKGKIAVIKGLGGFHIACDSMNHFAIAKLRKFKDRPFKPFAVMCDDLKYLDNYLYISRKERELLYSSKAPIVRLKKKNISFFDEVSPNLDSLGVMIPYTPLHKIIFKKLREKNFIRPLIMTSANLRDEPIVKDNEEAIEIFKQMDCILLHNRDIHNRIDDSLSFIDGLGNERIIRRARGYVPESFSLAKKSDKEIFAVGADIKNSFSIFRRNELYLSQYIGDLDDLLNLKFLKETYLKMKKLLSINPKIALADLHPLYRSSQFAKETGLKTFFIQHHIAHFFSVMAEYSIKEDAIGVIFDGTGYGLDGNIWGGEFFIYNKGEVCRKAKLKYFLMPGGEICVNEPYRLVLSLDSNLEITKNIFPSIAGEKRKIINKMLVNKLNCSTTSSMGRLFDAFSSLILNKPFSTYEAQLPMELESAFRIFKTDGYNFYINKKDSGYEIDYLEAFKEVLADKKAGKSIALMSYKFHIGVANVVVRMCKIIRDETKINTVCLSGGCFQNSVLIEQINEKLKDFNFKVLINSQIPTNDGGISVGQIYYHLLKAKILK